MKARLAFLMFVELFGLGAVYPILSHYLLSVLHFSGTETGYIFSASAITAVVSPLVGSIIADRYVSSRRLFIVCNLLSACAVLALAEQRTFWGFFLLYSLYTACFGPTLTLAQAIVFHHLGDARREQFGSIRVWGTFGWIAVAWVFGFGWLREGGELAVARLSDAFVLAGATSLFLAAYGLTLPQASIEEPAARSFLPRDSFSVMLRGSVLVVTALAFGAAFLDRYFYFGAVPYLRHVGFSEPLLLPVMSIAQIPEVFSMVLLGRLLARWGFKRIMLIGLVAQCLRFSFFWMSGGMLLTVLAVTCHGVGYGLFFPAAFIYLDRHCSRGSRSGAHLIFSLLTGGLASVVGGNTAGYLLQASGSEFRIFWLFPVIVAAATLSVGIIWLREPRPSCPSRYPQSVR